MYVINDLTISLSVLLITRLFASLVFFEKAARNKTAKDIVLSIGWLLYALGPVLSLISIWESGDRIHPLLELFIVTGTVNLLYGLILYYFPVSIKKYGVVFGAITSIIIILLLTLPDVRSFLTVGAQGVMLFSTSIIVLFRRKYILKTGGVSNYIWLSTFLTVSLAGTYLHLFNPQLPQSVKFLATFSSNLLLFMAFLHFDQERSLRRIKEDDKRMSKSLKEKEILLKEIHHRVKNNMAIMTSLLNLQSSASADPELREQLEKAQSRIEAMALVHEYLYESKNLTAIHFRDYVEELVIYLKTLLGDHISIQLHIADFYIKPELLVSCGLIINEIISNSYKHAFTSTDNRSITLEADLDEDIHLIIRDNGRGIMESFDPAQSEGIGFQLIHSLCLQLKAKMDIKNDHGTVFHFIIPN